MLAEQSNTSLRSALAKQQAAKESASRKAERDQAQANWLAEQQRQAARDAEQRRQFAIQEQRLGRSQDSDSKRRYVSAGDGMVLDTFTGQTSFGGPGSPAAAPQEAGPRSPGFAAPPQQGYGKQTEAEQKSQFYAQTMTTALPEMVNALSGGYMPQRIDQFAAGPQSSGIGGRIQQNIPRSFGSEDGRRFYTAGRQVLAGILRKESGAAITDDEWQNYGPMYLPWPGDSPEEVERKMQVLYSQAENAARGSGSAYRYWTAPQFLPVNGQGGQGAAPQGQPQGPRAGDKYLPGGQ
jgi:hypothetical protein